MMKKIIGIIGLVLSTSFPLSAANAGAQLSPLIAMKVQRANDLQLDNKVDSAIALLADLSPSRAYDSAYVQRMLGVFYWQQGNKTLAMRSLSQAVDSGALQDAQARTTKRMLADILLSEQQYKQALPHYYALTTDIPAAEKGSELWLRIAQTHYQLREWKNVITAMQRYDNYRINDVVPALSITLGAQLQLEQWRAAVVTLQRLIALEPSTLGWWQQLANVQLRSGNNADALSTIQLAKYQGVALGQTDLHRLAQLYAQQGIPEQAAKQIAALENAQSRVDLLVEQANYWQMAREWQSAITVWRQAARKDHQYRWPLAQLLLQEGEYHSALKVLDGVAINDKQAEVELAKVQAYYQLAEFTQALAHAKKADIITPSSAAKRWVKYLTQR